MLPCRLEPWVLIRFAGYYVNSSSVPKVLRWLPRASLIQHAFEALCVNEFKGLDFEASGPAPNGDALTGEQVVLVFPLTSCLSQRVMALKQMRVAEAWYARILLISLSNVSRPLYQAAWKVKMKWTAADETIRT